MVHKQRLTHHKRRGQDLMRWLAEKETAVAAPLGSPRVPLTGDAAARAPGGVVDGALTRHQEVAEVCPRFSAAPACSAVAVLSTRRCSCPSRMAALQPVPVVESKVFGSAQVRRLVAMLRPAAAVDAAGEAAREAAVAGACAALAAAFAEAPDRRGLFLAEDGGVAILELLAERSPKACSLHHACMAVCGAQHATACVSASFQKV